LNGIIVESKKTIFLALAAMLITASALWLTSRSVTPKTATWKDVQTEAGKGGYQIITTETLAAKYEKDPSGMLLVDTRQEWEFRTGHIKGAVNFSMEPTWWARWRKSGALETFLGADKERLIVFY
jgi:hypothetical protein